MNNPVTQSTYKALFVDSEIGNKVLEDLSARFYDIQTYTKGDPHHTAFLEGQRSVIRFMLRRLAMTLEVPTDGDIPND